MPSSPKPSRVASKNDTNQQQRQLPSRPRSQLPRKRKTFDNVSSDNSKQPKKKQRMVEVRTKFTIKDKNGREFYAEDRNVKHPKQLIYPDTNDPPTLLPDVTTSSLLNEKSTPTPKRNEFMLSIICRCPQFVSILIFSHIQT